MDNFEDLFNSPEMGQAFDNAEADSLGEDVPDGDYVVQVAKCTIGQAKTSGRWQVSWDFQIVWDPKGKQKNRHIFVHDGITKVNEAGRHEPNEGGMRAIKNRFKVAGFGSITKDNLPQAVASIPGRVVHIRQNTKKGVYKGKQSEFVNVYFEGLVAKNLAEFKPPVSLDALKKATKKESAPAELPTQRTAASTPKPKLWFTDED